MTTLPTIEKTEEALGRSTKKWRGNCMAVSMSIVKEGLIPSIMKVMRLLDSQNGGRLE